MEKQTPTGIEERDGSAFLYMRFMFNGKRVYKSTGVKGRKPADWREAATRMDNYKKKLAHDAEFQASLTPEKKAALEASLKPAPTLKEFVRLPLGDDKGGLFFTAFATNNYCERTLAFYTQRIAVLLDFTTLAKMKLDAIGAKDILAYVNFRRATCSATTVNHDLTALHLIMEQARVQEFITKLPEFPAKKKNKGEENGPGREITQQEEAVYFAAAAADQDHYDFASILLSTGLEPGPISGLLWTDIGMGGDDIYPNGWIHGKSRKGEYRDRKRGMSPALAKVIAARWKRMGCPTSGYVFPSSRLGIDHPVGLKKFQDAHNALWERTATREPIKIDGFRLYDLRHTFATRYWRATHNLEALRHAMGWSSLRMAKIYVHADDEATAAEDQKFFDYVEEKKAKVLRLVK